MPQDHAPDDIDWVTAQSTCSAALMFARLRAGVERDVQRRNGLPGRDDGWRFEYHDDGDDFEVSRVAGAGFTSGKVTGTVKFERAGPRIHVAGEDVDVEFTAVVTLDGAGVCRFVVGEGMYSEWEIRRMALELLFFEEADAIE